MAETAAAARPRRDAATAIETLRARGAARFDPAGFHFIEALARRAATQREAVAGVLERRLADALAAFGERFERAAQAADASTEHAALKFPASATLLAQCREAGDFAGLGRLIARLEARAGANPLAELVAALGRHASEDRDTGASGHARPELKAMAYFRDTWSRLSVDRQLSQALAQAPENAGPLNSQFLVLQALTAMRDISPDYFRQFMTYADTLLWLDQTDDSPDPARKGGGRGERAKKRGSVRKSGH